jgi:hypothetical protein
MSVLMKKLHQEMMIGVSNVLECHFAIKCKHQLEEYPNPLCDMQALVESLSRDMSTVL